MLLLTSKHPQRGWQSRTRVLCAPRGGRRSLTATAAEGTRASASLYLPRRASFYNAWVKPVWREAAAHQGRFRNRPPQKKNKLKPVAQRQLHQSRRHGADCLAEIAARNIALDGGRAEELCVVDEIEGFGAHFQGSSSLNRNGL